MKTNLRAIHAAVCALILGASAAFAEPAATLELPDRFHPGSAVLAPDGRLFVSSITTGRIVVFAPGEKTPHDFIDVAKSGVDSAMGIKVDVAHSRLWVCTASFGLDQTPGNHPTALLAFDLGTGKLLQTFPLPKGGLANDCIIAHNGAIVVTDSFSPRLLVLRPGASALEELVRDAAFTPPPGGFGLDGIVELEDGSLLVSKNSAGELLRIADPFGKAPSITKLTTSRSLAGADGLVLGPDGRIYLAEPDFAGTNGRIDIVSPHGSSARIETLADHLVTPLCVIVTSSGFWPVEGRMGPVLNPSRKNEDPGKMRLGFHSQH
ncbi:MAG: hypothetical protein QM796_18580 [Chthoniobacteraceae bacterium]